MAAAWQSIGWTSPHDLLVAGGIDNVRQRPRGLWSNVLVLPNFDIGDRMKFDAEGKLALAPPNVSLRGRSLEGAVLVGAHLRKADFTGVQAAGAIFDNADLRDAKFECARSGDDLECAQLQGASLNFAQLQGASLDSAQLQGASLVPAQLQGASLHSAQLQGALLVFAQLQGASLSGAQLQGALLVSAQLQGASLFRAQLQGASLVSAQLQGASLFRAQLQGASLVSAQLQGASLDSVFVWRAAPLPKAEQVEGALIETPHPKPEYYGLDCQPYLCLWGDASFAALKAEIEKAPEGGMRNGALDRIAPLGKKPYEKDPAAAKAWDDLAGASQKSAAAYPERLAARLIAIGCDDDGAPFVIRGLIRQLDDRFLGDRARKAEIASAFLKEENCPGARGLSDDDRATLRKMTAPP